MADISAYDHYQGLPGFRRGITKERGITIVQMYNRTLMPLAELKGLGKFFVHLTWPFAGTKDVVRRHQAELGFVNGHEKRMNERYMKFVMGDSYDSVLLEKPMISQWLEESTQDPFS
jgi:hypothetical protein